MKDTVENYRDIDVFWLRKHGYFCGYKCGGVTWGAHSENKASVGIKVDVQGGYRFINFTYNQTNNSTGEETHYDYNIPLITTPCRYGGLRYWFKCPLSVNGVYCGRRVAKLYLATHYFGCRHCYNLTYDLCQSHNSRFDSIGKIFNYEEKAEEAYKEIKRKFYRGKPTKRYLKFLKYSEWLDIRGPSLIKQMNRIFK